MIELVGEQPDLMEATALLAELYARNGDDARADLFARMALESPSPSVRARAHRGAAAHANDEDPPDSRVQEKDVRPNPERQTLPASSSRRRSVEPAMEPSAPSELDEWFERARRESVHRRSPTYGVKTTRLDRRNAARLGQDGRQGNELRHRTNPCRLTRDSLAEADEAMLAIRRQPAR